MRRIWVLAPLIRDVGIDWMLDALGGLGCEIRVTESTAGGGDGSVEGGGGIVGFERRGGALTGGTARNALGVWIEAMLGARGAGGIFGAIIDWRGGTRDGDAGRTRGSGGVLGSGRDDVGRDGGALARAGVFSCSWRSAGGGPDFEPSERSGFRLSSNRVTAWVRTSCTRPVSSTLAKSIGHPIRGRSTRPPAAPMSSVATYCAPTIFSGTVAWVFPGGATAHRHTPRSSSMNVPVSVYAAYTISMGPVYARIGPRLPGQTP